MALPDPMINLQDLTHTTPDFAPAKLMDTQSGACFTRSRPALPSLPCYLEARGPIVVELLGSVGLFRLRVPGSSLPDPADAPDDRDQTLAEAHWALFKSATHEGAPQSSLETCNGGTRAFHGIASSSVVASCSTTCSAAGLAAICTPIGTPLECMPSGSDIAGVPMILCGMVNWQGIWNNSVIRLCQPTSGLDR